MKDFKIDWSSIIVDIVKKKDLDCYDFKECWTEDYDWTELDKYVIDNYTSEIIEWGITRAEIDKIKMTKKQIEIDLNKYRVRL